MRILHTSDWHLGKSLNGNSLHADQKAFLEQIKEQLAKGIEENDPYSALIVAGDIYDRSIPSEEATELLSEFLADFSERFPEVHLFIISGNHDSAARLSFASTFFHKHNIHIVTNTKKITEATVLSNGENEEVAFYQLPYLYPLSIENSEDPEILIRHQQDLYEEACRQIRKVHEEKYKDMPSVIIAHPFTMGKLSLGSERSNIGDTEQVSVSVFDGFTYGAFGHIHGYHVCDKEHRCFYSGAPLAYSVDDKPETCMLDVVITGNDVPAVSKIPFKPVHPIAQLEGKISDFIDAEKKWSEYKDHYVFVILTDENMPANAHNLLHTVFPNLINVKPKERSYGNEKSSLKERKKAMESKNIATIFKQFMSDIYGTEAENSELYSAELKLIEEIAKEEKWGEDL